MLKLIFLFFIISSVSATENQSQLSEEWEYFQSPVTTEARSILIGGGIAVLVMDLASKGGIDKKISREFNEDKPLGHSDIGNVLGMMVPNILYAGSFYTHYKFKKDTDSKEKSLLMTRATLYSESVTFLLKEMIHERRPNGMDKKSFPSGHTTAAFSFATVIELEHEWYYGVLAYIMATYVGLSRVNDNYHYPHDVMAGATIGMSYALGIYLKRSERIREQIRERHQIKSFVQVIPTDDLHGLMALTTLHF